MTIKKKKNSSAENKNYNIVNRAVQTDTGANLKTFILKKKKKTGIPINMYPRHAPSIGQNKTDERDMAQNDVNRKPCFYPFSTATYFLAKTPLKSRGKRAGA